MRVLSHKIINKVSLLPSKYTLHYMDISIIFLNFMAINVQFFKQIGVENSQVTTLPEDQDD